MVFQTRYNFCSYNLTCRYLNYTLIVFINWYAGKIIRSLRIVLYCECLSNRIEIHNRSPKKWPYVPNYMTALLCCVLIDSNSGGIQWWKSFYYGNKMFMIFSSTWSWIFDICINDYCNIFHKLFGLRNINSSHSICYMSSPDIQE